MEKDAKSGGGGASREDDDNDGGRDEGTEYTHGTLEPGQPYFGECVDDLLSTRTGADGARYQDPNMYGAGGLARLMLQNQEWNNGTRRVLLALGRYLTPTLRRNHGQRDAERRRRGTYNPYASLVALARLAIHLAHPLFHTPVYRANEAT